MVRKPLESGDELGYVEPDRCAGPCAAKRSMCVPLGAPGDRTSATPIPRQSLRKFILTVEGRFSDASANLDFPEMQGFHGR